MRAPTPGIAGPSNGLLPLDATPAPNGKKVNLALLIGRILQFLTMNEFEHLQKTITQVQGLAALADKTTDVEQSSPQQGNVLQVLLTALTRACDDAIAVAEGMVELATAVFTPRLTFY